jgi:hypothetical protein
MVQQISYAQEMKDLLEHQKVAANSSLKMLHPFIDQEVSSEWGDDYNNPHFLIKPCIR